MAHRAAHPTCRVWIFNHYATPPDRPGGTRHYWFGRAVVARGGEATIFAAAFDHARGRDDRLTSRALVREERFDGVRFVWLRTPPYRGNGVRRILNMVGYAVVVTMAQVGRPGPDVIVGSTVHPFAALAGWFVARLRRARFIYEIRDLWPQTMVDIGEMRAGSIRARALYAIEAFLVRRAETVLTVLPGVATYLEGRGLPTDHVRYIPNGADLAPDATISDAQRATPLAADRPAADDPVAAVLAELDADHRRGEVIIAWTGAHGLVNGLDVAIRAMIGARARPGAPPMRLLLVGDGPEKPNLRRLAEVSGDDGVTFADPVPKGRIPELLAHVDAGVIHASATPVHRYGISFNKLFDYLAAGLPVVFACEASNDPVAAAGAGITVRPDDPEALADAFVAMASMSAAERRRLGIAGRSYVEREHDLRKLGAAFADLAGCPVRTEGNGATRRVR